ncbi:MAG: hypothetical protein KTR31_26470 [Myxococcales bacterium]|nr:hypothetical protein [Myxococcales bacterium]
MSRCARSLLAVVTLSACGGSSSSADLILDFTVFVPDAVQVSGLGVSPADGTLAAVTDFEQVLLVDPVTADATATFSAQLGALPEQGSTEAVSFTTDGDVVVLYPEEPLLRVFDAAGTTLREVTPALQDTPHGAMTIAHDEGVAWVAVGEAEVSLVALSLWAVDVAQTAYTFELSSGRSTVQGTTAEVADPSGAEAFVNEEGESVIAVSDDDDVYNAEPGPIRLFLLGP